MPAKVLTPSATVARPVLAAAPRLRDGQRLSRGEFLRRWEAMPDLKRAERLEGVVRLMPSPVDVRGHAAEDDLLAWCLCNYAMGTPGTLSFGNGTTHVDSDNDCQPDRALIVLPEFGGQTRWAGRRIAGAPELVGEVANTSATRDLRTKKEVFRRNGVLEYVVWQTKAGKLEAFRLDDGQYVLETPAEGVWKSAAFPGLWLNFAALLAGDRPAIEATALQGRASPAHAKFVKQLARRPRIAE